jgi:predicted CopG family antitoxin
MVTQIQITDKAWEELNKRKKRGDTFSDVIMRMCLECPEVKNE